MAVRQHNIKNTSNELYEKLPSEIVIPQDETRFSFCHFKDLLFLLVIRIRPIGALVMKCCQYEIKST